MHKKEYVTDFTYCSTSALFPPRDRPRFLLLLPPSSYSFLLLSLPEFSLPLSIHFIPNCFHRPRRGGDRPAEQVPFSCLVVSNMTRSPCPCRDEVLVMQAFDRVLRKQPKDAGSTQLLGDVGLQHVDLWCDTVGKCVSPECYEGLDAVAEFVDGFFCLHRSRPHHPGAVLKSAQESIVLVHDFVHELVCHLVLFSISSELFRRSLKMASAFWVRNLQAGAMKAPPE